MKSIQEFMINILFSVMDTLYLVKACDAVYSCEYSIYYSK